MGVIANYLNCSNGFTNPCFSMCCHFMVSTKCYKVIMTEYSDRVCFMVTVFAHKFISRKRMPTSKCQQKFLKMVIPDMSGGKNSLGQYDHSGGVMATHHVLTGRYAVCYSIAVWGAWLQALMGSYGAMKTVTIICPNFLRLRVSHTSKRDKKC